MSASSAATVPADQVDEIVQRAVAAALAAHTAAAPSPAAGQPIQPQPNAFSKGNLVTQSWDDPNDGTQTRYGIVVEVIPDAAEGEGPKAIVGWLASSETVAESSLTAG